MKNREEKLKEMADIQTSELSDTKKVLDTALKSIEQFKNVILFGPPGTGKSRLFKTIAEQLSQKGLLGNVVSVQFHTQYGYENFIEGIFPTTKSFEVKDGVLKNFCKSAKANKINIIFIDEINRADIASVFGETLYLLEDKSERSIKLPLSGDNFKIPENVILLGTMNTADKSIAVIDFALRRRFLFLPVYPDYTELARWINKIGFSSEHITLEEYLKAANALNLRIVQHPLLGKNMTLGQSFFATKNEALTDDVISEIFNFKIFPQIESYCGHGYNEMLDDILSPSISKELNLGNYVSQETVIGLLRTLVNEYDQTKI